MNWKPVTKIGRGIIISYFTYFGIIIGIRFFLVRITHLLPEEVLYPTYWDFVISVKSRATLIGYLIVMFSGCLSFYLSGYVEPSYLGLWGILAAITIALFIPTLSETVINPLYAYGSIPHGSGAYQLTLLIIGSISTFLLSSVACIIGALRSTKTIK